jgi:hypothetical protein
MWLRRMVGVVMIISFFGMNSLMVVGLLNPDNKPVSPISTSTGQAISTPLPTVSLTVNPAGIAAGSTSALTWATTGNATSCTASGGSPGSSWAGDKTPFGAESTGRINTLGDYTYTITCSNVSGKAEASAKISVTAAPPAVSKSSTSSSPVPVASTYCGGRLPCFGPKDVAGHGSAGNCWGWLGDRVINVSGFDASFHSSRAPDAGSIELSAICGKNLLPAISGQVPSSGYPGGHDHNGGAKSNSDKNYLPYYTGYFDSSKP